MAKVLLIGPAGCGKTHLLLDSFEQALSHAADPLAADLFFVVPSAEHTERVVSLLIQRGIKGFFHKRVTTLSRLAGDLFRVTDIPVVSSLTRTMIVRDLVRANAWDYFSEVWEQPGFIGLMAQFVTELKEACISPDIFRERMNMLKSFEPAYAGKYEALAGFYEQYEAQLNMRGLRDSQDALRIFRERRGLALFPEGKGVCPPPKARAGEPDPAAPKIKAIWIDGFFDFSNLQLEYLRELSAVSENITITLTKEEGQGPEDVFEAVNRTREDLEKLGFQVELMKERSYRTEKPSLLFLQKNLFSTTVNGQRATLKSEADSLRVARSTLPEDNADRSSGIVLLDAIGTEGEIELIARQIHKLYAAGGYRYSDFAVLFRQIRHYAPVIASVFSRYGIPAEIHERDRLKFSSWIAAAAALLSVFRNGWQREDLFMFLKSGYVRRFGNKLIKNGEWLAGFEHRAFLEGVTGTREAWLADWKRGASGVSAQFDQEKTKMLKALAELEDRFRAAKTAEEHIRTFKEAVYDTFGILEIDDRYNSFTRRDAACVKRFEALLEEVRSYFMKGKSNDPRHCEEPQRGDVAISLYANEIALLPSVARNDVTFESFSDHFLGLVELDVYSLHERDKNRVQVYDVSLARQKEYKVVFVAGLLEKVFPMQVREDPLLSDWERKLMSSRGAQPLAECLPRQNIERFLFYLAVTRARERLYLSCPHLDYEGKESLPSFYLEEVKNLFGGRLPVIRQDLSRPFPSVEEAITRRELETAVVGALRTAEHGESVPKKALERLSGDSQSRERILSAFRPVEAKILDEKILEGGYFEIAETSPTRLETYAKCPFRYFADKVLRLQDDAGDISAMQKGSVLHHVLQQYFDPKRGVSRKMSFPNALPKQVGNPALDPRLLRRSDESVPWRSGDDNVMMPDASKKDPKETLEQFIEREIEEGLKRHPVPWAEPYEEALDRRELSEMLLDFIRYETERLKNSSFKPYVAEYSFGNLEQSEAPFFEVEGGAGTIKLRGRVDRIDTDTEKKYCVVMDYKRSARFTAANLELGTALQLPLYLLAAKKHLGLEPLGAEIYSIRDHKRSGFYCEGLAQAFEKEFSSRSRLQDEVFQKVLDRALVFVRKFTREIASSAIPVRPRDCESFCPYDTVCRVEKWRLPLISEDIKVEDRANPLLASFRSAAPEDGKQDGE
jgi:ATP-dependent helicase/nuclease subunit B